MIETLIETENMSEKNAGRARLVARVPRDLHRAARIAAIDRGVSVSVLVEEAVRAALDSERAPGGKRE